MLVALIARDKPNALETRMAARPDHLVYINGSDCIFQSGPLLDDDGNMCGSLIILDVPDMAAARAWAENDPYAKAGLFQSVDLFAWNKVIG